MVIVSPDSPEQRRGIYAGDPNEKRRARHSSMSAILPKADIAERGFQAMVERTARAAGFDMKIHPHMLPLQMPRP